MSAPDYYQSMSVMSATLGYCLILFHKFRLSVCWTWSPDRYQISSKKFDSFLFMFLFGGYDRSPQQSYASQWFWLELGEELGLVFSFLKEKNSGRHDVPCWSVCLSWLIKKIIFRNVSIVFVLFLLGEIFFPLCFSSKAKFSVKLFLFHFLGMVFWYIQKIFFYLEAWKQYPLEPWIRSNLEGAI